MTDCKSVEWLSVGWLAGSRLTGCQLVKDHQGEDDESNDNAGLDKASQGPFGKQDTHDGGAVASRPCHVKPHNHSLYLFVYRLSCVVLLLLLICFDSRAEVACGTNWNTSARAVRFILNTFGLLTLCADKHHHINY